MRIQHLYREGADGDAKPQSAEMDTQLAAMIVTDQPVQDQPGP